MKTVSELSERASAALRDCRDAETALREAKVPKRAEARFQSRLTALYVILDTEQAVTGRL